MTIKDIAAKIPEEYRKEILKLNMVAEAQPIVSNTTMHYLATIWKNYINPNEDLQCNLCMDRVLNNYRQLLPVFIEMEKKANMLDAL